MRALGGMSGVVTSMEQLPARQYCKVQPYWRPVWHRIGLVHGDVGGNFSTKITVYISYNMHTWCGMLFLCFKFMVVLCDLFTHSLHVCFTGTGAVLLPQYRTGMLDLNSLRGKTPFWYFSWSIEAAKLEENYRIALKFNRLIGSITANMPVKLHSDWNKWIHIS